MFKPKLTDFAYMAGYIDGDGCIYMGKTIQKSKNIMVYEYSIQICCVELENLEFFKFFGGYIRKKVQRPNHKIPYFWCLKNCGFLCNAIMPYLIDKKIGVECMIKLIQSIKNTNYQQVSETEHKHRNYLIEFNRRNKMSEIITPELVQEYKKIKRCIEPTDANLAYLAGLIESEGTFRIKHWQPKDPNHPNKSYVICLEIGNTRSVIFPWLLERFGGSISFYKPKRNKRGCAIWSLSSKQLFKFLPKIYPFLKFRKKLVCEKLMEFSETILPNGGDRHSQKLKDQMPTIFEKRESLIKEIQKLNRKGA